MPSYSYVAVDPQGLEMRGSLDVTDQSEALRRIKEMGLFPTRVLEAAVGRTRLARTQTKGKRARRILTGSISIPGFGGRVKPAVLTVFTRQLATLVEAGMPLLRGLRTLQEQEANRTLKGAIGDIASAIEGGNSLTEAVSMHPKIFNRLYVNMVRAGEIGGALEITLRRLAEFMEKAQKIKGRVKAAMFYPCAVVFVASAVLTVLVTFVVPKFKVVFDGLLEGRALPAFTRFVFGISEAAKTHLPGTAMVLLGLVMLLVLALRTNSGRWAFDRIKLALPVLGPVFRKAAISRFARTLGTLVGSGVPILQALMIVKETAANLVLGGVVASVHGRVKEGEAIAPTLKASGVFPAMVSGMVDVGEQTGALPEMLMKIADSCDEDVDNAASAMTSLLEPVMIIFLGIIVGSIVIAMFLPIISVTTNGIPEGGGRGGGE
ncbi:MAG: pilus assembly protein PilC [Verrucomicrobia bacterium]|nr:MAG: pilus assembly protein PilC [Verrucomicrobiota bacterium]